MKILLNDGLHENGKIIFKEAGIEIDTAKKSEEELIKTIADYDALVVRSATKVTKEIIEAGAPPHGRLKLIGRAGVGYDNVDLETAALNGVVVKNAPFGNSTSTAELALGLMFAAARNIADAHRTLHAGIWQKKKFAGSELNGKTLGLIGCGRIGQMLAKYVQGYMNVIGYDKNIERVQSLFPLSSIRYVSLDEVLSQSDFISMHVDAKIEIIGKNELAKMKRSAILINTSRGKCINEEKLFKALANKTIRGAGLDVFAGEPKEGELFQKDFKKLRNVVMTPHIGASTDEAQTKTSEEMARVARDYLLGGSFINAVNMANGEEDRQASSGLNLIFVFHEDAAGVFGRVTTALGEQNINIKDIISKPFLFKDGGVKRAMSIFRVYGALSQEAKNEINKLDKVFWVQ